MASPPKGKSRRMLGVYKYIYIYIKLYVGFLPADINYMATIIVAI